MTTEVRIHGYLISTWVRTVCMTCEEKGVEYELVPVERFSQAHRELHPFMRIPILEHDGGRVIEGLAAASYVDEAFAGPSLQPGGLEERTRMRTWMSVCGDYVFRQVVRGIPRDRDPSDEELSTARETLERVESLVQADPFLLGSQLSLADLYLAPQISNCREKAPQLLDGLDHLAAWMTHVEPRESFARTGYDPPR